MRTYITINPRGSDLKVRFKSSFTRTEGGINQTIPGLYAQFSNGVYKTDDEDMIKLMDASPCLGRDYQKLEDQPKTIGEVKPVEREEIKLPTDIPVKPKTKRLKV